MIRHLKTISFFSNIKAVKEKSILFPIPLNASPYSEWDPEWKMLVPQYGLRYIPQDLASTMIGDEIDLLRESGARRGESDKLYSIFELITGKNILTNTMMTRNNQNLKRLRRTNRKIKLPKN